MVVWGAMVVGNCVTAVCVVLLCCGVCAGPEAMLMGTTTKVGGGGVEGPQGHHYHPNCRVWGQGSLRPPPNTPLIPCPYRMRLPHLLRPRVGPEGAECPPRAENAAGGECPPLPKTHTPPLGCSPLPLPHFAHLVCKCTLIPIPMQHTHTLRVHGTPPVLYAHFGVAQ